MRSRLFGIIVAIAIVLSFVTFVTILKQHDRNCSLLTMNVEALAEENTEIWVQKQYDCWNFLTYQKDCETRKCDGCRLENDNRPTINADKHSCYRSEKKNNNQ